MASSRLVENLSKLLEAERDKNEKLRDKLEKVSAKHSKFETTISKLELTVRAAAASLAWRRKRINDLEKCLRKIFSIQPVLKEGHKILTQKEPGSEKCTNQEQAKNGVAKKKPKKEAKPGILSRWVDSW